MGNDGLGKHGSGSCAVAGIVAGFGSYLLDKLRAHVLERIFQLYLAGHAHTVLGDMGSAEFLVDNHVAAFGAECHLHGVGQSVDTFLELFTSLDIKFYFFSHFSLSLSS